MTALQVAEVVRVVAVGAGLAAGLFLLWLGNRRATRHHDTAFDNTCHDNDTNPNRTER